MNNLSIRWYFLDKMSVQQENDPIRRVISRLLVIWMAGCLVWLCGCSANAPAIANQKPVHPVKGRVTVGGQPATGAFVLMVPVNEGPNATDPRPRAEVQEDGTFAVWTYAPDDGAPAGDYIVTVKWEDRDLGDKLRGRYADAKSSSLRATVKEGVNELPPFAL